MSHRYPAFNDQNTHGGSDPWSRPSVVPEDPIVGFPGSPWALNRNDALSLNPSRLAPSPNPTRPNSTLPSLHTRNRSANAVDQLKESLGMRTTSDNTVKRDLSPAHGLSAPFNDSRLDAPMPDPYAFARSYFGTRLSGPYTDTNLQPQALQAPPSTGPGSACHELQNTGASWLDGLKDASSKVASGVVSNHIPSLQVLKEVLASFSAGLAATNLNQTQIESNVVRNIVNNMGRDTYPGSHQDNLDLWNRIKRTSCGVLTSMGQQDGTDETVQAMQNKLDTTLQEMTKANKALTQAKKSIATLTQETSQAHASRKTAEEALSRSEEAVKGWEAKSLASDAEIDALKSQVQTLTSRCTDADTEVKKLRNKVQRLEEERGGVSLNEEEWGVN